MKKKFVFIIIIFVSIIGFIGFSYIRKSDSEYSNKVDNKDYIDNSDEVINSVKIKINDKEYSIILEGNATTRAFIKMLPLNIVMNELNDNEKYAYLDSKLPTNSFNPRHINKGDVMLYGDNCLVIFYKSFDTSYSYTKMGHIDNLPSLDGGSISVIIER